MPTLRKRERDSVEASLLQISVNKRLHHDDISKQATSKQAISKHSTSKQSTSKEAISKQSTSKQVNKPPANKQPPANNEQQSVAQPASKKAKNNAVDRKVTMKHMIETSDLSNFIDFKLQ